MRNILEYPITRDEVTSALVEAREAYTNTEQAIGGTTGVSLHFLEKFLAEESIQNELQRWLSLEQTTRS